MTERNAQRNARGHHRREVEVRTPFPRFLIVCEGERTEPNYFRRFRVPREVAEVKVEGTGYNTLSLVEEAVRLRDRYEMSDDDEVWCVFDKDSFNAAYFNDAIIRAQAYGFHSAYSNEAFELWYLLHFHYYNTGIDRGQYIEKLNRLLRPRPYLKNDPGMYDLLQEKQGAAIRNATRLLADNQSSSPANDNPSTTVHLLVIELNRYLR
jgi:hypothetical protein